MTLRITIIFFVAQSALLVALGFSSAYVIFSASSGWQFGFGVILSLQLLVLALISALIFGSAYRVSGHTISYTESAGISAAIVVISMLIALPIGFFFNAVGAWVLFQVTIISGSFLTPAIITRCKG
jgi:hypothetical protein